MPIAEALQTLFVDTLKQQPDLIPGPEQLPTSRSSRLKAFAEAPQKEPVPKRPEKTSRSLQEPEQKRAPRKPHRIAVKPAQRKPAKPPARPKQTVSSLVKRSGLKLTKAHRIALQAMADREGLPRQARLIGVHERWGPILTGLHGSRFTVSPSGRKVYRRYKKLRKAWAEA
jgi:hypothetical protein